MFAGLFFFLPSLLLLYPSEFYLVIAGFTPRITEEGTARHTRGQLGLSSQKEGCTGWADVLCRAHPVWFGDELVIAISVAWSSWAYLPDWLIPATKERSSGFADYGCLLLFFLSPPDEGIIIHLWPVHFMEGIAVVVILISRSMECY